MALLFYTSKDLDNITYRNQFLWSRTVPEESIVILRPNQSSLIKEKSDHDALYLDRSVNTRAEAATESLSQHLRVCNSTTALSCSAEPDTDRKVLYIPLNRFLRDLGCVVHPPNHPSWCPVRYQRSSRGGSCSQNSVPLISRATLAGNWKYAE
ncbi:hypothetical protein J6590_060762 [Homalodisca vitripennis]|nr:hypothetical protein J6590_060762 [Homalodisca vitripennis]